MVFEIDLTPVLRPRITRAPVAAAPSSHVFAFAFEHDRRRRKFHAAAVKARGTGVSADGLKGLGAQRRAYQQRILVNPVRPALRLRKMEAAVDETLLGQIELAD